MHVGDDDEVYVVQDNSEQVICIGRIKHAYVQSHVVPFPDPARYRGNSGSQGRIAVKFRRGGSHKSTNVIPVTDATGREFGRVDLKTAQGLAPLMDGALQSGMLWTAWTEPRRKQPGEGAPGQPLHTLIGLILQLYCPRKASTAIGRYLKTKNIQLIDPVLDLAKYDYFNPQTSNSFVTQEVIQPNFEPAQPYTGAGSYVVRSVDEIRSEVQNIFDSIVNPTDLPRREQSPMIKTPLMEHQKQALSFMWDKEQDWSGEDHEQKDVLYQAKYKPNGKKYYVHVITGKEFDKKPNSMRGGILADEMGLGKTLSVLSLVADADSLETAELFGKAAPPTNRNGIQQIKNSRATLLLCPLSTMVNWKQQLDEHFPRGAGLKWCHYHGPERKKVTPNQLADYDLVITTYQTVAADVHDRAKALPYINWFRIVLDEAHAIRSPTAKQSIGACTLAAHRRWAVTGTPVQNKLEDLGALFKFLRLEQFDTTASFNHHILSPFKNADPDVVPKLQLLVSSVTLRRIKEGVIELPPRSDLVVRLKFSPDEQRLHDWFEQDSARKVNAVTSGEKLGGNSYARILTAILNLRLICAHGRDLLSDEALKTTDGMTYENPVELEEDEVEAPALTRNQAYDMIELLQQTNSDTCLYCSRNILESDDETEDEDGNGDERHKHRTNDTMGYMTTCYHIVCPKHHKKLTAQWEQIVMPDGYINCHVCQSRMRPVTFELTRSDWEAFQDERERMRRDPKMAKKMGNYTGAHTKTKALLEELRKSKEESLAHPMEAPIKS
jgi:SNF2 family DNA or RNA helicase